jgi:hypothetical protein
MVLHLGNFSSIEKTKLYVLCFQSSAGRSQAYAAGFVQPLTPKFANYHAGAHFSRISARSEFIFAMRTEFSFVKIPHNPRQYC